MNDILEYVYALIQPERCCKESTLEFSEGVSERNLRLISVELEDVYARLQLGEVPEIVYA